MLNTLFIRHHVLRAEEGIEGASGGAPAEGNTNPATGTEGGQEGNAEGNPGTGTEGAGDGNRPGAGEQQNEGNPGDTIPEYSPEAAAKLDAQYDFNEPQGTEGGQEGGEQKTEGGEEYTVTFPEGFGGEEAEAFGSILAPIAKGSGLDGTAYGKLFADSYAAIETARQKSAWENRFRQDAELKRDWGSDYESNMKTARGHIAFLKEKAGLTDDDLAVFKSPKGMRALYAMATAQGEKPAAGLATGQASEKSWADAVLKDPNHPDRGALFNTSDPRYREVNARFRRAHGC